MKILKTFAIFLGLIFAAATPARGSMVNIGGVYYGAAWYSDSLYATETSVVWLSSEGWLLNGTQYLLDNNNSLLAARYFNVLLESPWGTGWQSTTSGNSGDIVVKLDFAVSADGGMFRWESQTDLGNPFDLVQGIEYGPHPYGWKPEPVCYTGQCYVYPDPPALTSAVPIPAASVLMASGVGLMGFWARQKKRMA